MSLPRLLGSLATLICVALSARPAIAQDEIPSAVTDQNRSGDLPFSSVIGSATEHVVINSGNLAVNIPIVHVKGRDGLDFDFGLRYDGRNLVIAQRGGSIWTFEAHNYVPSNGLWQTNQPTLSYTSYTRRACVGVGGSGRAQGRKGYILQDTQGAKHTLPVGYETAECPNGSWTYYNSGPDNTNAGFWGEYTALPLLNTTIMDANGTVFAGGNGNTITTPPGEIMFTYGTYINTNGNTTNNSPAGNDTLGRPIVTQTNGSNQVIYSVAASDGSTQTYTANYSSISIQTAFGFAQEFVGTRPALSSVVLPNGRSYSFLYDAYGSLTSLTLPTGAVITYTWTNTAPGLDQYRYVSSRTVTVNGVSSQWTFSQTPLTSGCPSGFAECTKVTVTDPVGNQSTYYGLAGGTLQANIYQGAATGTPLRQYNMSYTTYGDGSMLPAAVTTTLDNGLVSKTTYTYDSVDYTTSSCISGDLNCEQFGPTVSQNSTSRGNVLETDTYDWGSGSPGPLVRKNVKTYLHDSNSAYIAPNIVDKVLTDTTYDGSGNQVAQTQYEYDNYVAGDNPLQSATNAAQHDDAGHGSAFTLRGNATRVKHWRNTDGALLTTTYTYDILGNIRAIKDPLTHVTSYDYTDSLANTFCPPAAGKTGQAWVSTATNALSQQNKVVTYPCTSLVQNHKDQNEIAAGLSGTSYTYDFLGRTTQKNVSDGGQTTTTYNDIPPLSQSSSSKINSATNLTSTILEDGLGRTTQSQLTSDPQGTIYSDTTYDLLGRIHSVSNPYRAGADPTSSPGTTTYSYDAINRKTAVTYPDSSILQTAYCGNSTLATDPTGRWRRSLTDGLGRLAEADEPNAVGAAVNSNGCVGTGEPIWITTYAHDALDDLTQVIQNGSHQRTFTYNSLSQLLTSANPEVGTITYTYDAVGNVSTKRDARSITTTYSYDVLNREISRGYSNGDPTITTIYDQSACLGLATCQNIGHATSITDGAGSDIWAFQTDPANLRSVHVNQRTTTSSPNNITKTTTYVLDLAGNTTQATYPTGRIVNFTFDAANRPATAVDSANGITYAAAQSTPPTGCLTTGVCYTPQGTEYSAAIGKTSTFNGINLSESYNSRLQPLEITASSSAGNAFDITYSFVDPVTLKNAGHVYSIANNLNSSRSQSFNYDQVNRITTAGTTATSGTYCWGYLYNYDAWGNLLAQAGWSPNYNGCSESTMGSVAADGNNHISGFTYDVSGNTQNDGTIAYTYDAESQIKTAAGVTYLYDGSGRRVSKSNGKLYWFDAGSEILAETDPAGAALNEYIYFGGKRVALLPAGGSAEFYAEDFLGTSRVMTQNNGAVCYDTDFDPYGGEHAYVNNCPSANAYKFEAKERDPETGNDDFGARYYSNRFGRWLSADWSSTPVPVPYANLTNPQTLNLYAMVSDDPESFADLDGHQEADPEKEKEEDAKEDKEFDEAFDRAAKAEQSRQVKELLDAHAEWVRTQTDGYTDPITGVCYAPSSNTPTMGPQEPPQLAEGKEAHKNEPVRPGEKPEVRTPSGKRMDRYDESKAHIREIKPNNNRQRKKGQKQLDGYKKEMDADKNKDHTTELTLYNKKVRPGPNPWRKPKPDQH